MCLKPCLGRRSLVVLLFQRLKSFCIFSFYEIFFISSSQWVSSILELTRVTLFGCPCAGLSNVLFFWTDHTEGLLLLETKNGSHLGERLLVEQC